MALGLVGWAVRGRRCSLWGFEEVAITQRCSCRSCVGGRGHCDDGCVVMLGLV